MKAPYLALVILSSCASEVSLDSGEVDQDLYPSLICAHPNTPYEAQIQAQYPDEDYTQVELVVEQGGEFWIGKLKPPNDRQVMWHMTMQLLNFDCQTPYIWNFVPQD